MKRKLKSLLLVLAAMLCSSPLFAHDFEVGGIYYNITSNADLTVAVTFKGDYYDSFTNEYSGTVTIPESVAYNEKTYSVTSIGSWAFSGCTNLTSITIPSSVTSIGDYAFFGCYNLTSITIPNSVTSIGSWAFYGTAWYNNQPDGVVYAGKVLCKYKGTMPENTSIEVKGGTVSISPEAFHQCDGLTSITIPNSVTSIGAGAFYNCTGLTSITIPNSVTSIGWAAFYNCTNLTSITIPNSVTSIGDATFSYCSRLTSITIPNSVTSIGNTAFYYCTRLTSITIPNSVTSIGNKAFSGCTNLTSITIPNSVTSIGDDAFGFCTALAEFISHIPADKLFPVSGSAFYGLPSNSVLTVPAGAKATYEATDGWKCFNNIVEMEATPEIRNIVLQEGVDFVNEEECEVATVTYSRTLPNLMWNALYLPVEIPMEALSENYDVAYFNNMHAYDDNNDGTIDRMNMEVIRITGGTLHANHPYFIRAKNDEAKKMNLNLTDVTVQSTDEANCTSITTSSAYMNFELTGIYKRHKASELEGCYAITGSGSWAPIAAGSYLNPYRFYLKITQRDGTPVKEEEVLQTIHIYLQGEEGTTGIAGTPMNSQRPSEIYDLQGRRVTHPTKGLYIVNGKKVLY